MGLVGHAAPKYTEPKNIDWGIAHSKISAPGSDVTHAELPAQAVAQLWIDAQAFADPSLFSPETALIEFSAGMDGKQSGAVYSRTEPRLRLAGSGPEDYSLVLCCLTGSRLADLLRTSGGISRWKNQKAGIVAG